MHVDDKSKHIQHQSRDHRCYGSAAVVKYVYTCTPTAYIRIHCTYSHVSHVRSRALYQGMGVLCVSRLYNVYKSNFGLLMICFGKHL